VKIRVLDLAEADLLAGFYFYELQSPGVGSYFLESLYADIESLCLYAGVHRRVFGFFRLLSRRFPYAVYYRLHEGEIQVWRILDCRRDPHWIRRQLKPARHD
jgi:plasmid stabilization system protein ParE